MVNPPWEDDDRRLPFMKIDQAPIEETLEASRHLDTFLTAAIDSGLAPTTQQPRDATVSNKLMDFVDEVETGLKDLEDHVDELMPRFRTAMGKGKEHMTKFQDHIERAEGAIKKVEEFNLK